MPVRFPCSGCGSSLSISKEHAGKKVKCSSCQHVSQVPVNLSQAGAAQAQKPTANVVKLKCGGCGKIVKAPPSLAGKKVKCPRCDSVFVVPGKAPAPAPVAPKPNAASGFDDPFAMPANQPMGFDDPLAMPANQLGTPVNQPSYSSAYGSGGAKGPGRRKTSSRSSGANPLVLPAIFLIVVSSIWLLLVLINVVFTIIGLVAVASEPNLVVDYPRLIGRIVGIFVGAIFNTIIIVGATKMLRLSDYRSAYTASILGMIPCCGGCIVLSIPFAIWAFVLLGDPAVKRRFKNR